MSNLVPAAILACVTCFGCSCLVNALSLVFLLGWSIDSGDASAFSVLSFQWSAGCSLCAGIVAAFFHRNGFVTAVCIAAVLSSFVSATVVYLWASAMASV